MNIPVLSNLFIDFPLYKIPEAANKSVQTKPLLVAVAANDWNETNAELLQKIVTAVKFEYASQVQVIPVEAGQVYSFQMFRQQFETKILVSFNVPIATFGIYFDLPKYVPLYHASIHILIADTLSNVATQKDLKGVLWNALKTLVNEEL
ncbi:MAG: hypothetical protein HC892_05605 [Saprospiraceae bacterium]|nr:hypothetical protein [Saprospiraceae bacterium]